MSWLLAQKTHLKIAILGFVVLVISLVPAKLISYWDRDVAWIFLIVTLIAITIIFSEKIVKFLS